MYVQLKLGISISKLILDKILTISISLDFITKILIEVSLEFKVNSEKFLI